MIGWLIVLIISLVIINAVYINLRNNIYIIVIYFLFLLRSSSSSACPSIFAHQKKKKIQKIEKFCPSKKWRKWRKSRFALFSFLFVSVLKLKWKNPEMPPPPPPTTQSRRATLLLPHLNRPPKQTKKNALHQSKNCAPIRNSPEPRHNITPRLPRTRTVNFNRPSNQRNSFHEMFFFFF